MGIFSSISEAIFGQREAPPAQPQATGGVVGAATEFLTPAATQPVDVEAVLREKHEAKGRPQLDYQRSIVDLMKLLDLDSSLDARKQLAEELGYTGARDGSAEMNIWLHRKVMEDLQRNGGRVPESMLS